MVGDKSAQLPLLSNTYLINKSMFITSYVSLHQYLSKSVL